MTGARYKTRELDPMLDDDGKVVSRVFKVRAGDARPRDRSVDVWFRDGKAWCGGCGGPTSAMLTSCVHAKAVVRVVRAKTPDAIAPAWTRPRRDADGAVFSSEGNDHV